MSETVEKVDYPVAASRGGDNAYVLPYCPSIGGTPHYAVCLKRMRDLESGVDVTCRVGTTFCTANVMMHAEQKAGKALYYVPRAKLHAERDARDVDANARFVPGQVSSRKRAPQIEKPIEKPVEQLGEGQSFSELAGATISKAAAAPSAPQPAVVVAAPKVEVPQQQELAFVVKPGMSMLEIAKAKAAAKKALV